MKNKSPLALIEILIMILIFALASAICVKAFTWSNEKSKEIELKHRAVIEVQNTAEIIKYRQGEMDLCISDLGGPWTEDEGVFKCIYEDMTLTVFQKDQETDGLNGAEVTAYDLDTEEIFSVDVFWQTSLKGGVADEDI